MPLIPRLGLGVLAVILLGILAWVLTTIREPTPTPTTTRDVT